MLPSQRYGSDLRPSITRRSIYPDPLAATGLIPFWTKLLAGGVHGRIGPCGGTSGKRRPGSVRNNRCRVALCDTLSTWCDTLRVLCRTEVRHTFHMLQTASVKASKLQAAYTTSASAACLATLLVRTRRMMRGGRDNVGCNRQHATPASLLVESAYTSSESPAARVVSRHVRARPWMPA